jgi:deoxyribodipyrimidine photolyase-related protein
MGQSSAREKRISISKLKVRGTVQKLAIVLGDQLNATASVIQQLDKARDAILMMEVDEESTHPLSHKQRILVFLSAMRHFAKDLAASGYRMHYVRIEDPKNRQSLSSEIQRAIRQLKPEQLLCTHPGEWRVKNTIATTVKQAGRPLDFIDDEHFLVNQADFDTWMSGRKQPVMEHFYREQRRRLDILVDKNAQPVGGAWNFDQMNREALKQAPEIRNPYTPRTDAVTNDVIHLIEKRFPTHPGSLQGFRWPVTRKQARKALDDFIKTRLPHFGTYQDAMWTDEPFLYHSLLSSSLNLKLLDPRECVSKALSALESGQAPLHSVEGFIRQIIGWREFIRGIYWHEGQDYGSRNNLDQHGTLPDFYWTGDTEMFCMHQSIGQVLKHGYGHHIQRLMVTGNFALIAGVDPHQISDWYLAMYVDAVEWVTLPNTLGMVMHADGGVVGTKPYAAGGRYIDRMSNYCKNCRYDPKERTGHDACPFSTFYWDFLIRNKRRFRKNPRMNTVLGNVNRLDKSEVSALRGQADDLRNEFGIRNLSGLAAR